MSGRTRTRNNRRPQQQNRRRRQDAGKKLDLSLRLYQHFHPNGANRRRTNRNEQNDRQNRNNGDNNGDDGDNIDAILDTPPDEIIVTDDGPNATEEQDQDGGNNNNNEDPDATISYDGENREAQDMTRNTGTGRRSLTPPPEERPRVQIAPNPGREPRGNEREQEEINLNAVIRKAVDSALGPAIVSAMQPVLEEMGVHRQTVQLVEAENKALRSQLQYMKTGTDFSITHPNPDNVPDPNIQDTRDSAASPTLRYDQQIPTDQNIFPILPKMNPFPLPALLKKHLETIEKGEYLDFDKIKPKRLDQRKREDEGEGFGVAMTSQFDPELGEETLRLRKISSNRVENLPDWLECWNKFISARLHYQPSEHAALMAYQRIITSFAKRFRFSAVYQYDIDFRKTIAAERSLPPAHRTAMWSQQHDELKNEHLNSEQLIPPKTCFKCNEKGHIASNCPNKHFSGQQNKNRTNFNGAKNYNHRFPNPPPPPPPPSQPPHPFLQPFPAHPPFNSSTHYLQPGPVGPPTAYSHGPQQGKLCNTWNHAGTCWRGQTCYFKHICNRCDKTDHGGINCPNPKPTGNTTTAFRPRF